jgi:hypothetical protein
MIIEESSSAPKGEAIRYLADLSREVVSQMACAVAVAEGDTYRSALLRAGVTALAALAPHRVPYQLFSRVDLALRALAPHLSDGATPAALANAISELRGQFALVAPRN